MSIIIKGEGLDQVRVEVLKGRVLFIIYTPDSGRRLELYNEDGVKLMEQVKAKTKPYWAPSCSPQLKARLDPWIRAVLGKEGGK